MICVLFMGWLGKRLTTLGLILFVFCLNVFLFKTNFCIPIVTHTLYQIIVFVVSFRASEYDNGLARMSNV
jgi:hypothetical protein